MGKFCGFFGFRRQFIELIDGGAEEIFFGFGAFARGGG